MGNMFVCVSVHVYSCVCACDASVRADGAACVRALCVCNLCVLSRVPISVKLEKRAFYCKCSLSSPHLPINWRSLPVTLATYFSILI